MSPVSDEVKPGVKLIGNLPARLWSIDLAEWQNRAWRKIGTANISDDGQLLVGIDWIFAPALADAILSSPGAVLIVKDEALGQERIAAIHRLAGDTDATIAQQVNAIDPDWSALKAAGYRPGYLDDFVGAYDKVLRKREAPYALSLLTTSPKDVEKRLFKGSYKGVTDLVTKYAWPVPALHATRLCASLGLSPNMVTTASLALVIVAFYSFWIGAWMPGILAGWAMTFLDTVDGKLARTTMTYSNWGNVYDHGIDLIHPPFWYWAIYVGLVASGYEHSLLLPALITIMVGYVAGRVIEGIFLGLFGFHIHVWRPVDAFMREITARRNPNLLIFMIAVMFGQAGLGFLLVAAWTIISTLFHLGRLLIALAGRQSVKSWMDV